VRQHALPAIPPPHGFASFGNGAWLCPPIDVVGAERIHVGDGVIMLEQGSLHAGATGTITIGRGTRLGKMVDIAAMHSVTIGQDVSTSDCVTVTDTWGPVPGATGTMPPPPDAQAIVIDDGAYLGAGCVVGPGVHVGSGAFIGEGALVLSDVPAHALVYGSPATIVIGGRAGV
jgi:acetyltransferase-like isoleucine patch superfamily enzyme